MLLQNLPWSEVDKLDRGTPVILPVAALEQHGHHMPLFTDSMLCGEVVRRAHERLGDRVLVAPLMWLGSSEHHLDFPGTLSAAPRVFLDVLDNLAENFIMHGFRKLVFINGHGGNIVPGSEAVFEIRQRHRQRDDLLLLFATYWTLGAQPHEAGIGMKQHRMGHACAWETSMMLRLAPELVRGDVSKLPLVDWGHWFGEVPRGWITRERSEPGYIGGPSEASAEKGEAMFAMFTDDVVTLVEKMISWPDDAPW